MGPDAADSLAQSKLERMSEEFAHLLASQLEEQRHFYYNKISDLKKSAIGEVQVLEAELDQLKSDLNRREARHRAFEAESSKMAEEREALERRVEDLEKTVLPAIEREKAKMATKLDKSIEGHRKMQQELSTEKEVMRSLLINVGSIKEQMSVEKRQNSDMKAEVRHVFSRLSVVVTLVHSWPSSGIKSPTSWAISPSATKLRPILSCKAWISASSRLHRSRLPSRRPRSEKRRARSRPCPLDQRRLLWVLLRGAVFRM